MEKTIKIAETIKAKSKPLVIPKPPILNKCSAFNDISMQLLKPAYVRAHSKNQALLYINYNNRAIVFNFAQNKTPLEWGVLYKIIY